MKYLSLAVPLLFLAVFVYALIKKVKLYDSFTAGIKGAIPLVVSLFPYLAAVLILSELFEQSGLSCSHSACNSNHLHLYSPCIQQAKPIAMYRRL